MEEDGEEKEERIKKGKEININEEMKKRKKKMKTKGENGKWEREKGEMQRMTGNERERRVCKESE